MSRKSHYKKTSKKGLSTIVTTVILVALSMAAVVIVWLFVNNLIKGEIKNSESCYGNYDKITINKQYTCYEKIGSNYKLRFGLSIGDVSVDNVIVSVSSGGNVNSYTITNTPQQITNLVMYSGSNPTNVILPGKNAGVTYNATGFSNMIDLVKIAPVIGGSLCEVSDSVSDIGNCALLV